MRVSLFKSTLLLAALISCLCEIGFTQTGQTAVHAKPVAVKMLEIGAVSDRAISSGFSNLIKGLDQYLCNSSDSSLEMLIYLYGPEKEIARREKVVLKALSDARWYHAKVTIVLGGKCRPNSTVIWKVPRSAELPQVCEKS